MWSIIKILNPIGLPKKDFGLEIIQKDESPKKEINLISQGTCLRNQIPSKVTAELKNRGISLIFHSQKEEVGDLSIRLFEWKKTVAFLEI